MHTGLISSRCLWKHANREDKCKNSETKSVISRLECVECVSCAIETTLFEVANILPYFTAIRHEANQCSKDEIRYYSRPGDLIIR